MKRNSITLLTAIAIICLINAVPLTANAVVNWTRGNSGDWPRAGQWTDSFTRWCQRSRIDTFAGACLIHRAEVFATSGKLEQARDAIARSDSIIRTGAPWALGDAYRIMGDLHLARGEEEAAELSYQHAYQHGRDPHPGYAILLHQRGRSDEALSELKPESNTSAPQAPNVRIRERLSA